MQNTKKTMLAIAKSHIPEAAEVPNKDSLGVVWQAKIVETLQVPEFKELAESPSNITEKAGFEPAVL
jgi:hypothetical protein